MPAKIIGNVAHLEGSAEVRTPDGIVKLLSVGDQVHEGDLLVTGSATDVRISFLSGKQLEVGADSEVLLDETVYRPTTFTESEVVADVFALQQEILDGELDLAELESPAAGPNILSSAARLSESALFERHGLEGNVDSRPTPMEFDELLPRPAPLDSDDAVPAVSSQAADGLGGAAVGAPPSPILTGGVTEGNIGDLAVAASGHLTRTLLFPDAAATGGDNGLGSFELIGGDWTYTLDQSAVQDLDAGDVVNDTITYTATDGSSEQITIAITGTDDSSIIAGTVTGSLAEGNVGDAPVVATGNLLISDADADDVPAFNDVGATPGDNGYGSFELAGGTWTYTLDQNTVQDLVAGDVVNDTITYTATDGSVQQISVTITGTEDAPVISGTASGAVTEDGTLIANGALSAADADAPDTPTFTPQTGTAGAFGRFDVDAAGDWTYTLDNAVAQSLAGGEVVTETFTVTATTADGESVTQSVTVAVTGAEDAPVISGTSSGAVSEDGTLSANGAFSAADADAPDIPTFTPQTGTAGAFGSFDVDAAGDWTYTLDNAVAQSLAGGEVVTETFTVTATTADGESVSEIVTVTVTGAEDAPVITGTTGGAVAEDGTLSTGGTLVSTDADAPDSPTFTAQPGTPGAYGTFSVDAGGVWSYALDNTAAQSLEGGEVINETFTVTATTADGESVSEIVTVTVTGAEDAPVITGTTGGAVAEDGTLSIGGTLVSTDADAPDTPTFTAQPGTAGAYGTFSVDAGGVWSYALDNATAQSLEGGEVINETFTVTATTADGELVSEIVTVTVTGAEDAPVITGTTGGAVAEDGTVSTGGTLASTDADAPDSPTFTAQSGTPGAYGTFSVDAGGVWSYALDNATAQSLEGGEVINETFTVTATTADGESVDEVVTVTVTGAEDAPVITGTTGGAVTEDDTLSTGGTLVSTDADAPDNPTFTPQTGTAGAFGSFDVDAAGDWTYTLDNTAAQSLEGGEVINETFTVTATTADGESVNQSVTVTVTGAEDAPVISGISSGAVEEDGTLSATGTLATSDADAVDTPAFTPQVGTAGTYGSFDVDAAGNWTYSLDNAAAQSLGGGQIFTETFTVTATTADGETVNQAVTVTVTGSDDGIIATADVGATDQDTTLSVDAASGVLSNDTDPDGDPLTVVDVNGTGGNVGTALGLPSGALLTLNADGSYDYDPNDAFDALPVGATTTDTFTYAVSDGTGSLTTQMVTITLTGTNDGISAMPDTGAASEGVVLSVSAAGGVLSNDTDLDGDTLQVSDVNATGGNVGTPVVLASGALLTLNADGSYDYDPNGVYDGLGGGQTASDSFTYTVIDGNGASATETVTITITGTEDAPVIVGVTTGSAEEDVTFTAIGTLTVSDADTVDTPAFTPQTGTAGAYGSFDVDAAGDWTYTLDNATAQSLEGGEVINETFTVTATTADGESVSQVVTVTVTGAEDAPVITGTTGGAVAEDGTLSTGGTLASTDADAPDTPIFTAQPATAGAYGTFSVDAGGVWSYALDNTAAQSLAGGEVISETFTVTATTADGESVSEIVTVTVTGAEDAPVITGTTGGAVAEDGTLSTGGTLGSTDADAPDTPTFTAQPGTPGAYGTFSVDAGGVWSYALDNAAAQSLAGGEVVNETFTVTATTADGESVSQIVTVTVTGAEDAPVITGTTGGAVAEDGTLSTGGTLVSTDADAPDTPTFTAQPGTSGAYGTFSVDAGGVWSYALDNTTAQSLEGGEVINETFTVTATTADGESISEIVTVTVTGAEDAPAITGTTGGAVAEDGTLSTGGTLVATDADATDTPTFTAQPGTSGAYGTFSVNAGGVWSYALDNTAAQSLEGGEVINETFTVTATTADGESVSEIVTVTVTGAEDAPVITGTTGGAVAEDGTLSTGGTLASTDADAPDSPTFTAQPGTAGAYGTFSVDAGGVWSYALDNATAQSLEGGEVINETFTVTATTADGESVSQVVTVTVTGAEDAPVITGTTGGAVAEDGTLSTGGTLVSTDADTPDSPTFTAQPGTPGAYGTFSVDAGGVWSYALDNATAQSLEGGEIINETFTVTATTADGESVSEIVTVTVTGAEDAPVITGTTGGAVAEDGTLSTGGTLASTDADAPDTPTFTAQPGTAGAYGSFDVDAAGDWTYTLDNTAAQSLAGGEVINETFTVTATTADGESVDQVVTVTLTGAEDAPVITGTTGGAVAEDGTLITGGTLASTDADAPDSPTFTAQPGTAGAYGTFSVDAGGVWSYALDNAAAQSLEGGEVINETFTVTATTADGESVDQVVTVTVTGAEDAPVITGTTGGAVAEDGTLSTGGTLVSTDADAPDSPTFTAQPGTAGAYGTFTVDAGGVWSYALDNATAQSLEGGEIINETFTVTATTADGESVDQVVTVTVTGAEDAPVITGTTGGAVAEDGTLSTGGSLASTDADAPDSPTFTAQPGTAGAYGTFSVDGGGVWSYALDNATAQSLEGGEIINETFTVTATTADGESVSEIVTVTVTGAEDAPVITGTTGGAVAEDGTLSTGGSLASTDADAPDSPTFTAQPGTAGAYGTFSVDGGGVWSYALDNATAQSLEGGEIINETFTVTATTADGESVDQVVTVTVTGAEDAPVITGTTGGAMAEDGTLSTGGTLASTDADAPDSPTFTAQPGTAGAYGTFSVDASGVWSYALDNATAQSLEGGEVINETFTVTATTADGESVDQVVTVTVTGAEDAPVITGTTGGAVAEDGTLSTGGSLASTDADAPDSPTFTAQPGTAGAYGTFSVDGGGVWSYALDNATAQSLEGGEIINETFTVTATTADGESVSEIVTVTVTGAEDAPVITGTTGGAVAEDGTLSTGGTLASTDADAPDTPTFTAQPGTAGAYGTFSVDGGGVWSYALDNATAQSLEGGEIINETFTVTATTADGESVSEIVTVTVTGAEDAPVITGTTGGAVAEDGTLSTGGTLASTDADAPDTPTFTAQPGTAGAYGTFSVDGGGVWSYALDNATAQSLEGGEIINETFTVTATTADGESVDQVVTVTVTGAEDAPVITGTTGGAVAEDGTLSTGGTLVSTDADAPDSPTFTAQPGTAGAYGTFTVDAGGVWSYALDNATAQSLEGGEIINETFTVTATTADGESVDQVVTVTVTGAEDAPVITGTTGGAVAEDGTLSTGGTLLATDADAPDSPTFTAQPGTAGAYGTLSVDAGGVWSYALDNTAAQSLAGGEVINETFTVTATTADGESVSEIVTVTVTGAEDAPVITGTTGGAVAEDGTLITGGSLASTDADAPDSPTFTAQPGTAGAYGTFSVDAGGVWSYALDNAAAQSLEGGEVINETFTVTATTADGESVDQVVTVTVTGAEDAPVITGTTGGAVAEDGTLSTGGTLVSTDADAPDSPTFTAQPGTAGAYGTFTVDAGGVWSYALDNATAQSLEGGEIINETFTVTATTADGESVDQVVTVTVTGAEDAPVITGTTGGAVAEDGTLSTGGTLASTDADAPDSPTVTAQPGTAGAYGTFSVDAGGVWSYALDNTAAQSLEGGEIINETFTVTATTADGESVDQVVTVTLTGAEDAPVITGTTGGAVAEDGTLSTGGTLASTDADAPDSPTFTAQPGTAGAYGTFSVDAGGVWSYALDNATAQSLAGGEVINETFTVTATTADGESVSQVVTVTVTGAEDAPVITGTTGGAVAEDGTLSTGGTLASTDADAPDSPTFTAQPGTAGAYGTFSVDAGGVWSYALDNTAAQSLAGGEVINETFTVTATTADGESVSEIVTVTVTGAEDAPVITGTTGGAVAEDGTLSTGGTLVSTDADAPDTPTFTAQAGTPGVYGTFSVDAGGVWSYALDNTAAQSLAGGEVINETFTVTATTADGESVSQVVTVTVTGAEDAPVITGTTGGAVAEDGTLSTGGTLVATDSDAPDSPTFTAQPGTAGAYGTFSVDAGGVWSYALDNTAAQSLAGGEVINETFTVTATTADGESVSEIVTVTVTGAEDAPVITGTTGGAVAEDGTLSTGGTLVSTDADAPDSPTFTAQPGTSGAYGTFSVDAGGVWSYALDNTAAQSLAGGEVINETFTVTATTADGESVSQVVTVTVTGAEDAPVITGTTGGAVAEDGTLSTGGTLASTDADAPDSPTFTAQPGTAGAYGTFTVDAGGVWSYALDNAAAQSLEGGEVINETFTVTATTADGESVSQVVTVTVTGAEDAPVITGTTGGAVAEDGTLSTGGTLVSTDADAPDSPTFTAQAGTPGVYGTFSVDAGGVWSYALDNTAAQSLAGGEVINETFTVTATTADGESVSQVVTVTVTGAEDAPVITGTTGGAVAEDGTLSTGGSLASTDADAPDSPTFTAQPGTAGAYGTFTVDAGGVWSYALDNAAAQSLAGGEVINETFTVTATTADGESVSQVVTVTVTGAEDAPVITGTTGGAVAEDGTLSTGGSLASTDADAPDSPTFTAQPGTAGAYGTLTVDAAGDWTYTLDNATAQSLGNGQVVTETFTVTATTADGESVNQSVTVTVTGAEDAPVVSGSFTGAVSEGDVGDVVTATGTISISDVDDDDSPVFADSTVTGTYGSISLVGGVWTYTLDQTLVQSLSQGQVVNDVITLTANDGTTQDIAVTITGTNDVPIAQASSITTIEDTQMVFNSANFGFTDAESDLMASITIQSLESVGSLRLNGVNVVEGQTISKAQLDAGELTYDPLPDTGGAAYDSFTFTANDAGAGTVAATMTLNVTSVNDGPLGPVTDVDAAINRVSINAGPGSPVGITASATDPDPEDTVTYSLDDDAGGRFTIDPVTGLVSVAGSLGAVTGSVNIVVRATSSDGSPATTTTIAVNLVDAADDFATVHESALTDGSGRVETVFDSNDEVGQDTSAGEPTRIATGNLLANDGTATSITSIDGETPVGGTITVTGSYGQLVVNASNGDYTYTLSTAADNSAAADDLAVLENFSYVTNVATTSTLSITIVDDTPQTGDFVTNVPEGQMQEYQLVFTLDVSGSMTGAQYDGIVYLDDGTQTTRLEMAKDALKALVEEYYQQSDSVSAHLVTFSTNAQVLNGGNAYTDLASTLAAIDAINGSGGTNYEDGLNKTIDALDANGDNLLDLTGPNLQTITYFISDGVATSGNTSDPVGASGWDTFTSTNAVSSFAVGIGAGISDFSNLNAIHNVDADASGTIDSAIYVPDLTTLEEELLSTVPNSFGGSILMTGATQNVNFGADGGYVSSIAINLDSDADDVPDTLVTFTYDALAGTVSNDGGFPDLTGNILSLDKAGYGFVEGKLIFDFLSGEYNYFQSSSVTEGDSFTLEFVAADNDGDVTPATVVTIKIVDGQPVANDDADTLFALDTQLEGNVLTGFGTDGGVSHSTSFSTFSSQGVGVDNTVDNAKVTSIVYRGDTIDLTVDSGGVVSATASADGSTYNFSVDSAGTLSLTNSTDSTSLTFNSSGFYSYTPATPPSPPTGARVTQDFEDSAATEIAEGLVKGIALSSPDGTIGYDSSGGTQGVGVNGTRLNSGERLTIDLDSALYPYGVQGIRLEGDSLDDDSYQVFNITAFHIDGHEMAQAVITTDGWHTLFAQFSNIGRLEVQAGSNTSSTVRGIAFDPVLLDTVAAAVAPEVIGYTITDDDGDTDSATLTLKSISNTLVDLDGDDLETGTSANDFLSGLDGDDSLDGGAGHDILEGGSGADLLFGGLGDDVLVGGEGLDVLAGDEGDDNLHGGLGDDDLRGGVGNDQLMGDEGDDLLQGGSGADTLHGGTGNDTLDGGAGNDALYGGAGDDTLLGGGEMDFLAGGAGSDSLTGGAGADTFAWGENDKGSTISPDQDVVTDFTSGPGGDILDLRDLLQGEENSPLSDYLTVDFGDFDADGDSETRINVDADGGNFFQPTQNVTLEGVDLTEGGTLTDQQILDNLLSNGNLDVDT